MNKIRRILILIIIGQSIGCGKSTFIDYREIDPSSICTPSQLNNGVRFECRDGSSYVLKNGINGVDGFIVDAIYPCGQQNPYDEVLLLTRDGNYLAYFAQNGDAKEARLTLLEENVNYRTTDELQCDFRIVNGLVEVL